MRRRRWGPFLLCALAVAQVASAQDVPPAEEFYRNGVADYRAGKYDVACREIEASYRLDPLPGVLFTLAACEARLGRIATAAAHYEDFLQLVSTLPVDQQAMQAERRQVAMAQRSLLIADVPYLTIVVPGKMPPNVIIRRDGSVVDNASIGKELPLDPGEHAISIESEKGAKYEHWITLEKRDQKTFAVDAAALAAARPPAPGESPPGPNVPAASNAKGARRRPSAGPWPYVAGGFGGAGTIAGTVAGILAIGEKRTVDQQCSGSVCTAGGKQAADTGKMEALVSTIAFGVGIAGLVTLAIVVIVDRGHAEESKMHSNGPPIGLSIDAAGVAVRF